MCPEFEVRMTPRFREWLDSLRDHVAKQLIARRLQRFAHGNPGLRRVLGEGVWELKVDSGPGYRLYYRMYGRTVVLLLCGGDKSSQREDIALAVRMARALEDDHGT
jgi:putative addiction module killer protein